MIHVAHLTTIREVARASSHRNWLVGQIKCVFHESNLLNRHPLVTLPPFCEAVHVSQESFGSKMSLDDRDTDLRNLSVGTTFPSMGGNDET